MSREIRRVPVGWQHPTEPNPYWREQAMRNLQFKDTLSRLHMPQVRFRPLWRDGFDEALADFAARPDDYDGFAPEREDYMPDFAGQELGWCLYETVSEGTPITPVFATPDELVEHLSTEGDDWKQEPWRRESAERIVRTGGSFGSFVISDGEFLDGSRDLDKMGGAQ